MLEHLNELIAAVYQTAPCPDYPEGITWRAHADALEESLAQEKRQPNPHYAVNSQASAWLAVAEKCSDLGMYCIDLNYDGTGRGLVLAFIQSLSDRLQKATETLDAPHPDTEDARKWRSLQKCQEACGKNEELLIQLFDDGSIWISTEDRTRAFVINNNGQLS